ncbi:MAG: hypothetical protein Athens041674_186 [Parcubacteria group bacterium Athens0416_74]|nr:MAG: hypothetical protein Athens041674_186 [Parcubacteria group bacterium Athens0416_74]
MCPPYSRVLTNPADAFLYELKLRAQLGDVVEDIAMSEIRGVFEDFKHLFAYVYHRYAHMLLFPLFNVLFEYFHTTDVDKIDPRHIEHDIFYVVPLMDV